ncbi:uncharacterized protein LOC143180193 [Calliopsis andreniformis]|uniref:uncharacterized protein LOC143180193 n=1 Tax=Calliopsis andreniformis TaxID=337506 RepID=UPI003FCD4BD3
MCLLKFIVATHYRIISFLDRQECESSLKEIEESDPKCTLSLSQKGISRVVDCTVGFIGRRKLINGTVASRLLLRVIRFEEVLVSTTQFQLVICVYGNYRIEQIF